MILKAPRSAAQLSPRLRAISLFAAEKFDEPEDVRPVIPRRLLLRIAVVSGLVLATIAAKTAIRSWEEEIAFPSIHAVKADEFRATARLFEDEARAFREFASTGKPVPMAPGSPPMTPQAAIRQAQVSEQNAAGFRGMADLEERRNLGFPTP